MSISNFFVDILRDIKHAADKPDEVKTPEPPKTITTENKKLLINSKSVSTIIRKFAHFTEFMSLGIILYLIKVHTNKIKITEIILICQSVAVIDEFIQSFSDRSDKVTDIIIDISGAATGILIVFIIYKIIKKGEEK